jgi:hypothetical protein
MTYVLEDSVEARSHEARIVVTHGRHSLTSCPPNSRAMCDFARLPRTVPQDPQAVEDERAVREKVRLRTEALREGRRLSIEEGLIPPD